jgi:hypothetical protein
MDRAAFLAFHQSGLAQAAAITGQNVVVTTGPTADPPTTTTFNGVLSEVELDPEQLQQFGFNFKRVFSLRVVDPTNLNLLATGMTATEPGGETCKLLHLRKGRFGMMLFFGSVNR